MAREARKISSTGMYAVRLCGERLFRGEEDKTVFLELLKKYFEEGEVYGHHLTDGEIRLVVKEAPKGISMTMKPLITSYARYYNRTHNTEGKLFSGRFISVPLESDKEKREAVKSLAETFTVRKKPVRDTKPAKKVRDTKSEPPKKEEKPKKKNSMPSYLL